jgi:AAA15 family ATPase/GTPase
MIPFRGSRSGATGYQMVESFSIRNFRSFNEVKVDGCKRINVIVGDNGSGKTALLEGLFLAAGVSPEVAVRTRGWRGQEQQMSGSVDDLHEALWTDLFYKFQTSQPAFVSMKGKREENRSVTVRLNQKGQVRVVRLLETFSAFMGLRR